MIIDATNLIVGRMATVVAKKALLGEKIDIVNCDKAVISGNKKDVMGKFVQRTNRGAPLVGPYIHRSSDRLVRRIVRGMLPYKQEKGKVAFERVMCYRGVPAPLAGKETITIESADVSKLPSLKYVTIAQVSKLLGGKHE